MVNVDAGASDANVAFMRHLKPLLDRARGQSANLSGYDINTTSIVNDSVMDRLMLPKIALTCQNIRERASEGVLWYLAPGRWWWGTRNAPMDLRSLEARCSLSCSSSHW